ncbi:MAG: dipeptidase [Acidobacteria bacterium]|nr:dipeptidase [Acidobacteriota bacterium]
MKNTFLVFLLVVLCSFSLPTQKPDDATERARRIHFSSIVLDTHIDVTPRLQSEWKFTEEHTTGHIDLPRMKKGGLNALFFSIYMRGTITGQKAVDDAKARIAAVHKLAQDLPDKVMLCTTAADVRRAHSQGKIAALMGMEGGHMINNSLPTLRMFAELGVRYLTLTHSVNTDWADSSGDQPKHNGLTDFGKDVVRELNRLGVMVDISHVADKTFWDALEVSKAPMIASHSSCRALSGHSRNMTDEMIKALAKKGGVIQINYLDSFIDNDLYLWTQKSQAARRELSQKYPGRENFAKIREELEKQFGPAPRASWERIVDHIDHAVKLVGADHVGLGSDFDGGSMPVGMEDCSKLPKITEALVRKGYKESDIRNILGLNTLRLMGEVELVSKQLSALK